MTDDDLTTLDDWHLRERAVAICFIAKVTADEPYGPQRREMADTILAECARRGIHIDEDARPPRGPRAGDRGD